MALSESVAKGLEYAIADWGIAQVAKKLGHKADYELFSARAEYYKLYCPFEKKEFKFRNNYPATYVEGHLQLDWSRDDLLVITKSMKDCMLFRQHWNIQAVSGKSETTMIPDFIMEKYLKHFKRIVLWLDPDATGCASTEKYISLYPSLEVAKVPEWVTQKDPTDIYEALRLEKTTSLIKQILKWII